ncbi:NUDIX hydrolase [Williamsia deligens]|uniref:NUDIX hydrolase n=1 Tax=Williamsia deligens TaxID=321325 RepID=A0ABW3G5Z3_9NOCA|nr:NUDIX hydrolase [Williamsia deligens]MCP2194994.1 8-oxo-dGTP pyrophosphatase MutT, NUDIX family [Williamsia deligens]
MTASGLHSSTVAALSSFPAPDGGQDALRHTMLAFLAARDDACLRSCAPGHITASTLVLDHTGRFTLLTLHPRVGAWIQLGGHCEPDDDSLAAAALREATEESGIDGIAVHPGPVALHTHPITCSLGVPTRHLDVRFLGVTPATADGTPPPAVRSDESVDLRWWPVDDLPESARTEEMLGLVDAALRAHSATVA